MSTLREQFSAARKAQVETQLDFVRNLTSKVVESTEKVIALNLSTGRDARQKSAAPRRHQESDRDTRGSIAVASEKSC